MRFGELLISLALFTLLSAATAGVYTAYERNAGKAIGAGSEAVRMLSFDKKVREAVSDITIPYWEDTGEYALSEAASFLQRFANDPDITIVKIDKTVPNITLISPGEGGRYNGSITFSRTVIFGSK